jgi:hypothetical protein
MSTPAASHSVDCAFILNFIDQTTGIAVLMGDLQGAVRGVIRTHRANAAVVLHLTLEHAITLSGGELLPKG